MKGRRVARARLRRGWRWGRNRIPSPVRQVGVAMGNRWTNDRWRLMLLLVHVHHSHALVVRCDILGRGGCSGSSPSRPLPGLLRACGRLVRLGVTGPDEVCTLLVLLRRWLRLLRRLGNGGLVLREELEAHLDSVLGACGKEFGNLLPVVSEFFVVLEQERILRRAPLALLGTDDALVARLDCVFGAPWQLDGNLRPFVANLCLGLEQNLVLFICPVALVDRRVEVECPALAALLGAATGNAVSNLSPVNVPAHRVDHVLQRVVFDSGPGALAEAGLEHLVPALKALHVRPARNKRRDSFPMLGSVLFNRLA
mmetsp:Transcript_4859/g.15393  ORF Transcript_4859/g.15393 Transcript_4859/m.15393 type:complete len:312 (-) Transcript_4859:611-1546(-)